MSLGIEPSVDEIGRVRGERSEEIAFGSSIAEGEG